MRILATSLAVAVLFTMGLQAQAQDAQADSASLSGSAAQSGSIASGGNVVIGGGSSGTQKIKTDNGTSTVKTAPALGGLALGGSHPCQWSPMTGQISIVGGAIGGGGGTIDGACMLLVMAAASGDTKAYEAAKIMLAARDNATCQAMYAAGMVSDCVDSSGRSRIKSKEARVSTSGSRKTTVAAQRTQAQRASDER